MGISSSVVTPTTLRISDIPVIFVGPVMSVVPIISVISVVPVIPVNPIT